MSKEYKNTFVDNHPLSPIKPEAVIGRLKKSKPKKQKRLTDVDDVCNTMISWFNKIPTDEPHKVLFNLPTGDYKNKLVRVKGRANRKRKLVSNIHNTYKRGANKANKILDGKGLIIVRPDEKDPENMSLVIIVNQYTMQNSKYRMKNSSKFSVTKFIDSLNKGDV